MRSPRGTSAGPRTGRQYEYQHEQATFSALEMLARHDWHCVYPEWHEDFVVENGDEPGVCYLFHQVKSKSLSQGTWSFRELFGVSPPRGDARGAGAKSKPLKIAEDAIFLRLLNHDKTFDSSCRSFVFVTNTGIDPPARRLLDAVAMIESSSMLPTDEAFLFEHLVRGYCCGVSPLVSSPDDLFRFLKRFTVEDERGSLKQEAALNEICDRIFEYSEIDLLMAERKQIARQLIHLIRAKATDYAVKLPIEPMEFRARKGIVIAEVLGVLALSAEGYRALLAGGGERELVKTLSRLERLCRSRGDLAPYIAQVCSFKANWDAWRTRYRHQIQDVDHLVIINQARGIIGSNKPLDEMVKMARDVATGLSRSLPAGITISADVVLGLVFSLAAGAEHA